MGKVLLSDNTVHQLVPHSYVSFLSKETGLQVRTAKMPTHQANALAESLARNGYRPVYVTTVTEVTKEVK